MAQSADPVFGINFGWDLGADGWKEGMDFNLQLIACMLNPLVKSASTTTPPSAALQFDKYIVPTGATGEWSSKVGRLALRFNGKWNYVAPVKGMRWMRDDTSTWIEYSGTAWA